MNINSILCISREEVLINKQMSHEVSRRASSGHHHYRHDGRPSDVVKIYSPLNLERHGSRYPSEKDRRGVVSFRHADSRQKITTSVIPCDDMRHRSRASARLGPRREMVQSARERLLSNVTDVNFLLCRSFTNVHKFEYGSRTITDKNHFEIRKGKLPAPSSSASSSRPVRITSCHTNRMSQQEIPKIKYMTEIVQPCSVIVTPSKQEAPPGDDGHDVQETTNNKACILRTKSAPPINGSKSSKRVSFGPDSICGESTA